MILQALLLTLRLAAVVCAILLVIALAAELLAGDRRAGEGSSWSKRW